MKKTMSTSYTNISLLFMGLLIDWLIGFVHIRYEMNEKKTKFQMIKKK